MCKCMSGRECGGSGVCDCGYAGGDAGMCDCEGKQKCGRVGEVVSRKCVDVRMRIVRTCECEEVWVVRKDIRVMLCVDTIMHGHVSANVRMRECGDPRTRECGSVGMRGYAHLTYTRPHLHIPDSRTAPIRPRF
ncbi:unnamed protein product [Thelazia callipaeda]|uniref:EB domain-containing protein n=1 Tax=Thelazia callipaeda TaxID=103827 RepID=A0A0N5D3B8_THECL|nr:unnamed protein product [Thelazia callipaeda]